MLWKHPRAIVEQPRVTLCATKAAGRLRRLLDKLTHIEMRSKEKRPCTGVLPVRADLLYKKLC
jgi:hypothetical protein